MSESKVKLGEQEKVDPPLLPHPPSLSVSFQNESMLFDTPMPPGGGELSMGGLAAGHPDSPKGDAEVPDGQMQSAAMDAVVEANLGDLEEISNDLDGMTLYSIREDVMKRWSEKILFSIGMIRDALTKKGSHIAPLKGSTRQLILQQSLAKSMRKHKGGTDHASMSDSSATFSKAGEKMEKGNTSGIVSTVGGSVASAVFVLMEACATAVLADWASCFIYQYKSEELVLACGVGKRIGKAGSQRLPANVGVESHVLNTGIAVNISHAYVEEEFSANMDRQTNTRTKTQIVFPLLKPGTSSVAFGVIEFGNKQNGRGLFTPDDEAKVSQCAQTVSLIISKYPSDIINGNCFDPAIFPTHNTQHPHTSGILQGLTIPNGPLEPTLVHRTARVGHLKRSEVMRDSVGLSKTPSITEAISYVTKVNESWKHAVILNMELEKEIDRLQESLRVSRRETARLQNQALELKCQNETFEKNLESGAGSGRLQRSNSNTVGLKGSAAGK